MSKAVLKRMAIVFTVILVLISVCPLFADVKGDIISTQEGNTFSSNISGSLPLYILPEVTPTIRAVNNVSFKHKLILSRMCLPDEIHPKIDLLQSPLRFRSFFSGSLFMVLTVLMLVCILLIWIMKNDGKKTRILYCFT
ncbi:MAG: hypothetical protein N2171_00310 [Clostridia bacterium]|nr:hypothetical protein [Clostridia bacterium]